MYGWNCRFMFSELLFQYLPDKDLLMDSNRRFSSEFHVVDNKLSTLGFTERNKKEIYMVLSAILNLGNIELEAKTNHDSCSITSESQIFLCNAAALLNTNMKELEETLTSNTRVIGNQQIK